MEESRALSSLNSYEAEVDKKAHQNEEQQQELQSFLCELVAAHLPYRYLTAVSAVLRRLKADGRELRFLSGDLWCRSTAEFCKCLNAIN